jgi:late competence protein required for DNA uptake (superfamily II DNA/RNA helicase)
MFKEGKKDVLVATDVASKGLDFPDVQHVINFEMPKEIENYSTFIKQSLLLFCFSLRSFSIIPLVTS